MPPCSSEVPVPNIRTASDVSVYFDPGLVPVACMFRLLSSEPLTLLTIAPDGDSWRGKRSMKDFLELLSLLIIPTDFHLEHLDTREEVDADGTIVPGFYVIAGPSTYTIHSFWTFAQLHSRITGAFPNKKRKLSQTTLVQGGPSSQDSSSESDGFQSRLVARDKGCVVCMAGSNADDGIYQYESDSEIFRGSHIIPLKNFAVWDRKQFSTVVTDPYSVPGASKSVASTDTRRMNSVDNGLLLCLYHRVAFDAYMFSIHPEMHTVTAFHPRAQSIHGLKIVQPWISDCDALHFPPPKDALLRLHFECSIATWMQAASEDDSFEDEDEDYGDGLG